MYDLVIFDLDGTLIDSVGDIADSLNETLGEYGLPPYDDGRVAGFIGSGVRELIRRALPARCTPSSTKWSAKYRAPLCRSGRRAARLCTWA